MIVAGIDGGSRAMKAVVLDAASGAVLGRALRDSGIDAAAIAAACLGDAAAVAGVEVAAIGRLVTTGYARAAIPGAIRRVTEITCHARGLVHLLPGTRGVIEIGGQDSKVMRLDGDGRVVEFAMNDRCAAGTGRFLEVVAARLGTDLPGLGALVGAAREGATISSMCVVFAESEIIGLMAQGVRREDIAHGIFASVATRVAALAGRDLPAPVAFAGGVALLPGFAAALERVLGVPVSIPDQPQFSGALGAALIAAGLS